MLFKSLSALVALAGLVVAQNPDFDPISVPSDHQQVQAGSVLDIAWQYKAQFPGPVKIHLIGGETQNTQVPLFDIVSGIDNAAGHYSWSVPTTEFGKPFYGLVITYEQDASVFQYSMPFHIVNPNGDSSSSSESTSTSTSTTEPPVYSTEPPSSSSSTVSTSECDEDETTTTASTTIVVPVHTPVHDYPIYNTQPVYEHTSSVHTSYVTAPTGGAVPIPPPATTSTPASAPIPVSAAGKLKGASMAVVGLVALAAVAL